MQHKSYETLKVRARSLRRAGYLYAEIAHELQIAKSTARSWTREIILDDTQMALIEGKRSQRQRDQIARLADLSKLKSKNEDQAAIKVASDIVGSTVITKQHKQIICAVLFWAEGGKDIRSGVRFINSDPMMIRVFLVLFRESFDINESKLRAIIHLHDYHDPADQLQFWSGITGIPASQFYKPYIKPHTSKNIHEGYPGCVSVRYQDARLGKLLKMIYSEFGKLYE